MSQVQSIPASPSGLSQVAPTTTVAPSLADTEQAPHPTQPRMTSQISLSAALPNSSSESSSRVARPLLSKALSSRNHEKYIQSCEASSVSRSSSLLGPVQPCAAPASTVAPSSHSESAVSTPAAILQSSFPISESSSSERYSAVPVSAATSSAPILAHSPNIPRHPPAVRAPDAAARSAAVAGPPLNSVPSFRQPASPMPVSSADLKSNPSSSAAAGSSSRPSDCNVSTSVSSVFLPMSLQTQPTEGPQHMSSCSTSFPPSASSASPSDLRPRSLISGSFLPHSRSPPKLRAFDPEKGRNHRLVLQPTKVVTGIPLTFSDHRSAIDNSSIIS